LGQLQPIDRFREPNNDLVNHTLSLVGGFEHSTGLPECKIIFP
jgi:hypothetical protein